MPGVNRREFIQVIGLGALAAKLGGCDQYSPSQGTPQPDAAVRLDPARDAGGNRPDGGVLSTDFEVSYVAGLPNTPTPASIKLWGNEAYVVSSSPRLSLPLSHMMGTVDFDLPDGTNYRERRISSEQPLYLGDVALLPNGASVVTGTDGFYVMAAGQIISNISFPPELNTSNTFLIPGASLMISNGARNELWFGVTAYNAEKWLRRENPFERGFLVGYSIADNDVIVDPTVVELAGSNPTGMAMRGEGAAQELVVLNSGSHLESSQPSIESMTIASRAIGAPLALPSGFTAQVSSHLAITEGDEPAAIIGSADGTGRVFRVGLTSGMITDEAKVAGQGFHSSVAVNGGLVFATEYGPIQQRVTMLRANDLSVVKEHSLNPGQQLIGAGMATAYGSGMLQLMYRSVRLIRPV